MTADVTGRPLVRSPSADPPSRTSGLAAPRAPRPPNAMRGTKAHVVPASITCRVISAGAFSCSRPDQLIAAMLTPVRMALIATLDARSGTIRRHIPVWIPT